MLHPLISTTLADEHRADLQAAAHPGCCVASAGTQSLAEWAQRIGARLRLTSPPTSGC